LRILHVIASVDPRYGGPSIVVPRMCAALAELGHRVELLTTNREPSGSFVESAGTQTLAGVPISSHAVHWPKAWATSIGLARWLRRRVREFDIVHVHNLYLFHTWWTARSCRQAGVPYVVSPHGALDSWHRDHHRWRKTAYTWLVEGRALRAAAGIHYTSTMERDHGVHHFGSSPAGFVVPPGIDLPGTRLPMDDGGLTTRHPELVGRTLVCFLGRITTKKRLDLLVEAFAEVAAADLRAHLVVAGPDNEGLGEQVRAWVAQRGLGLRVSFVGLVTGAAKAALLGRSRVLVLASEDESFGVAVAEAMAAGVPVVVSKGVALHREVAAARAGLVTRLAPEPLAAAVLRFLTDHELANRAGANGRVLVRNQLSWEQAAAGLERMYEQVATDLGQPGYRPRAARLPAGKEWTGSTIL
jgi:glycosyltransferase involved in cell wall biosynthesis